MKRSVIRDGIYPTAITPYRKDGTLDIDAYRKIIKWYIVKACDGVFAACQSSESFYLTLEEREILVQVARTVIDEEALNTDMKPLTLIASGHTAADLSIQRDEIICMNSAGADAVVLVTNRFDIANTSDKAWIYEIEKLLNMLPDDILLGLYEMPYPYKRLMTPAMLDWCISTGRFHFMKDTCCNAKLIGDRIQKTKGSSLRIFNANAQTLLSSLESDAAGYCGIMANFHPVLYTRLFQFHNKGSVHTQPLADMLSMLAFTECLNYPITAKYHMCLEGIPMEYTSRSRKSEQFTDYDRMCIEQMRRLTYSTEKEVMLP